MVSCLILKSLAVPYAFFKLHFTKTFADTQTVRCQGERQIVVSKIFQFFTYGASPITKVSVSQEEQTVEGRVRLAAMIPRSLRLGSTML
jgi:hypothetical protein